MAGYSATPLAAKLGVRPGLVVLLDGAPDGLDLGERTGLTLLDQLPRRPAVVDVALTFHTARRTLGRRLPVLRERTATAGALGVAWPKLAAQRSHDLVSDLDGNLVRALALELGLVDVKVAAIDETWSGLKLVRRLRDR